MKCTSALDGPHITTEYERGLARLIHHSIDHLLYTARMRTGATPIPVQEYRQTNSPTVRAWAYEQ
ncbi:hypothetical protein AB0451_24115 [Streptomyces sp. NPDC052000]|uniref:hypothetical protein n=1 Tax=Streptomyces sp. NPDC052000 TaxID=3155676 RepID=UPI00344B04CF